MSGTWMRDLRSLLLRRLQLTSRPDLRIIVMSATLNAGPIAEFLAIPLSARRESCSIVSDHRTQPHSAAPLERQVVRAIESVSRALTVTCSCSCRESARDPPGDAGMRGFRTRTELVVRHSMAICLRRNRTGPCSRRGKER